MLPGGEGKKTIKYYRYRHLPNTRQSLYESLQYFQRMGEITVAKKASSKFASLRTTIPMSIVRQWKLEDGDKLDWEWKVIDGQLAIVVSKVQ